MRRPAAHVALAALAIALAGCEPPTDPLNVPEQQLLIHGVLNLGSEGQIVSVQRTSGQGANLTEPVSGATVSITGPGGKERFFEPGSPGIYLSVVFGPAGALVPGGTYTLRVVTSDGKEATGTTTIPDAAPGAFDTASVADFDPLRDTLRMDWPRVPGAKSYYAVINARSSFDFQGFTPDVNRYAAFTDTSIALPGDLEIIEHGRVFVPGDTITLVVSAVDDNFYTYYHASVDPFAGAPPTRLTGAIGVFGALVPLVVKRFTICCNVTRLESSPQDRAGRRGARATRTRARRPQSTMPAPPQR